MRFTFVTTRQFLSASRLWFGFAASSRTPRFGREPSNSTGGTFTHEVTNFTGAPTDNTDDTDRDETRTFFFPSVLSVTSVVKQLSIVQFTTRFQVNLASLNSSSNKVCSLLPSGDGNHHGSLRAEKRQPILTTDDTDDTDRDETRNFFPIRGNP